MVTFTCPKCKIEFEFEKDPGRRTCTDCAEKDYPDCDECRGEDADLAIVEDDPGGAAVPVCPYGGLCNYAAQAAHLPGGK